MFVASGITWLAQNKSEATKAYSINPGTSSECNTLGSRQSLPGVSRHQ